MRRGKFGIDARVASNCDDDGIVAVGSEAGRGNLNPIGPAGKAGDRKGAIGTRGGGADDCVVRAGNRDLRSDNCVTCCVGDRAGDAALRQAGLCLEARG